MLQLKNPVEVVDSATSLPPLTPLLNGVELARFPPAADSNLQTGTNLAPVVVSARPQPVLVPMLTGERHEVRDSFRDPTMDPVDSSAVVSTVVDHRGNLEVDERGSQGV